MIRNDAGRAAFIRANTRLRPVPYAPEIDLHLADEAIELWEKTEVEQGAMGLPPPFWAFAWAGGQALARHLLDHPSLVRGARVLDVASGSGLVAIAAVRAGAALVEANDIDPFALDAICLNAAANRTAITILPDDIVGSDAGWDVVLAADIFYERDIAARVTGWLRNLADRGARVLIGDPGRAYLDGDAFERVATYTVPVSRALEDAEHKRTSVWRPSRPSAAATRG